VNPPKPGLWIARHSRPVIFLILTLDYLGRTSHHDSGVGFSVQLIFPRVLIAVDNGRDADRSDDGNGHAAD